jgi:FMN-dependent NADH-azoreductase
VETFAGKEKESKMKILNVQSSAGMDRSLSRKLSSQFLDSLKKSISPIEIEELDLVKNPPPFITPEWIAAAFSKNGSDGQERTALTRSDEYISQVETADCIVIGTPMYNYGMPAVLKAWFDQVARINKTFSFDLSRGDFPIEPILSNKKMILFTSCGEFGFESGGVRADHDHLVPHIKSCAHYLGVNVKKDFYHIGIEYQEFKDERHTQSKNKAFACIDKVIEALCRV